MTYGGCIDHVLFREEEKQMGIEDHVGKLLGSNPDIRFTERVGKRGHEYHFSCHAVKRWRTRAGGTYDAELRSKLASARVTKDPPVWTNLSLWHRARMDSVIEIDTGCFIVARNGDGRRVVVTFVARDPAANLPD